MLLQSASPNPPADPLLLPLLPTALTLSFLLKRQERKMEWFLCSSEGKKLLPPFIFLRQSTLFLSEGAARNTFFKAFEAKLNSLVWNKITVIYVKNNSRFLKRSSEKIFLLATDYKWVWEETLCLKPLKAVIFFFPKRRWNYFFRIKDDVGDQRSSKLIFTCCQ